MCESMSNIIIIVRHIIIGISIAVVIVVVIVICNGKCNSTLNFYRHSDIQQWQAYLRLIHAIDTLQQLATRVRKNKQKSKGKNSYKGLAGYSYSIAIVSIIKACSQLLSMQAITIYLICSSGKQHHTDAAQPENLGRFRFRIGGILSQFLYILRLLQQQPGFL